MSGYRSSREIAADITMLLSDKMNQKEAAKILGVSTGYLSDFLNGKREAGPKMLQALGYEKTPFYRKPARRGSEQETK